MDINHILDTFLGFILSSTRDRATKWRRWHGYEEGRCKGPNFKIQP